MSRMFEFAPAEGGGVLQEHLYECVGIEALVTRGLTMQMMERKREHVDSMLSEQSLQRQRGVQDPDRLSKVSEASSRWTKERAHKLASGYIELLSD